MKRVDLIRHLETRRCQFFREGSKHSVYVNRSKQASSTVPRHREINEFLVRKILSRLTNFATRQEQMKFARSHVEDPKPSSDKESTIEASWACEIERRIAEIEAGEETLGWEEVRARILAALEASHT